MQPVLLLPALLCRTICNQIMFSTARMMLIMLKKCKNNLILIRRDRCFPRKRSRIARLRFQTTMKVLLSHKWSGIFLILAKMGMLWKIRTWTNHWIFILMSTVSLLIILLRISQIIQMRPSKFNWKSFLFNLLMTRISSTYISISPCSKLKKDLKRSLNICNLLK